MKYIRFFYPEVEFGGFSRVDGTIAFYSRINALIKASYIVLDVGCGRGEYNDDHVIYRKELRSFKNKVAKIIGIDVDTAGVDNPFLDEFRAIDGERWPIDDDAIDIIICDWVLEHIPAPQTFFY
jgi:SAM-dependent methyltransferase